MPLPTFWLSRLTEFARTHYGYILYRTLTRGPKISQHLQTIKTASQGNKEKGRNFSSTEENIHMKKNNKGGKCNSELTPGGGDGRGRGHRRQEHEGERRRQGTGHGGGEEQRGLRKEGRRYRVMIQYKMKYIPDTIPDSSLSEFSRDSGNP